MADTDLEDLARGLGVPADEIVTVDDTPAGTRITTTDGAAYISVPVDNPDFEGKTGLMFLAAPHENYAGSFPVYAQPLETDGDDSGEDDGAARPDSVPSEHVIDLADASAAEVLGWVGDNPDRASDALAAEHLRDRPRKTVLEALDVILEASTMPGGDRPAGDGGEANG